MFTVTRLPEKPACGDRLDLVDEAYTRQGGPEAVELRERYCPRCPIAQTCFTLATMGEAGVWGGTNPRQRKAAGMPVV